MSHDSALAHPAIDRGQIEGAFRPGARLADHEELWWDPEEVAHACPSTYKIPGSRDVPGDFRVHILDDAPNRSDHLPVQGGRRAAAHAGDFRSGWRCATRSRSLADTRLTVALDTPATPSASWQQSTTCWPAAPSWQRRRRAASAVKKPAGLRPRGIRKHSAAHVRSVQLSSEEWTAVRLSARRRGATVSACRGHPGRGRCWRAAVSRQERSSTASCTCRWLLPRWSRYVLLLLFGRNGPLASCSREYLGIVFAFRWTGDALACAIMGFPLMVRAIRLSIEAVDRPARGTPHAGRQPAWVFWSLTLRWIVPGIIAG